jgi:FtsP/CotA-like multicopper oxidase with cupredoxin domain
MMHHSDSSGDDAMREHCKMMPEMRGCEKYQNNDQPSVNSSSPVERSVKGLAEAVDQSVVSVKNNDTYSLSASFVKNTINGKTIRMLSYNGQIPGPILRVKQGDNIKVNFKNNLDEPTTVHWHGLRLENKSDGVPGMTQSPVKPGESYTYNLNFPDAGLYWYHPHVREDYQQALGMYGLIWVEPSGADYFDPVNREEFLALNDILLNGNDVAPYDKERVNYTLMGRFGNVMLVNGQERYSLNVNQGDVVRFPIVNTASTRAFKLSIPGVKLKLVGGDSGGYQNDTWVDSVTIGPSERVIVEAQFAKAGEYKLNHTTPSKTYTLGMITVANTKTDHDYSKEFQALKNRSDEFAGLNLDSYYAKPIDKELDMTIKMPGMDHMSMSGMMHDQKNSDGIEWEDTMAMMNSMSNDKSLTWVLRDKDSGKENHDIDYSWKKGDRVKIRLFNDPNSMHPMHHVMHFHGNRFVVLSVNGVKNANPVWKDSVLVPTGAKVDVLLDLTNPGTWMGHCHIAEHMESGMMMVYKVNK